MTSLSDRVTAELERLALPPGPVLLAVSGGADSVAMAALVARSPAAHHLTLTIAHVDHGIQPGSATVAAQVRALAAQLGLPYLETSLQLGPGTSETTAREGRYRWLLAEAARRGASVMTAHHRDDQVETVLMRLLAGTGVAGLAGMPPRQGRVVRPLLGCSAAELRAWVEREGLTVWDDPSNLDPAHLRSWLRAEVLPRLEARLPTVRGRLVRVADAAAQDRAAWGALLAVLPLDVREEQGGISVASAPLLGYDPRLAGSLVMAVARRVGLIIGHGRAAAVVRFLREAQTGARLDLGRGWTADRDRDRLALLPGPLPPFPDAEISGPRGELAMAGWRLRWNVTPAGPVGRHGWTTWLPRAVYGVAGWRAGDRIRPRGGTGQRLVVRCMQDEGVPRRERANWPLVRCGADIMWVPGVCRSAHGIPDEGTEALQLDVERA